MVIYVVHVMQVVSVDDDDDECGLERKEIVY